MLELSNQMGRPVKFNHLECKVMLARADYLLNIAPESLKDVAIEDYDSTTNKRFIQRAPHGVILVVSSPCSCCGQSSLAFKIAPWNFPFLVTINNVLPAIISGMYFIRLNFYHSLSFIWILGNVVILKPSPQTPVIQSSQIFLFRLDVLPVDGGASGRGLGSRRASGERPPGPTSLPRAH